MLQRSIRRFSDFLKRYGIPDIIDLRPSRDLLLVSGLDAGKLIQNTSTIDTYSLLKRDTEEGIYGAFLTAQGRVMFDAWIYPRRQLPDEATRPLVIEVDHGVGERLAIHLAYHKLRLQAEFKDLTQTHEVRITNQGNESDGMFALDNRGGWSLKRSIQVRQGSPTSLQHPVEYDDVKLSLSEDDRILDHLRLACGVPEGMQLMRIREMFPFDCNLDALNALDLKKGCYLGQELVTRTLTRGVIRRRLLPFRILGVLGETDIEDARSSWTLRQHKPQVYLDRSLFPVTLPDFTPAPSRNYGNIVVMQPDENAGWALVRLEEFEQTPLFAIKRSDALMLCEAILPDYLCNKT